MTSQALMVLHPEENRGSRGVFPSPQVEAPIAAVGPQSSVNSLVLMVSTACNLACRYCFAGGGSYGGTPTLMKEDVAITAVDKMVRVHPSINLIKIFGGEPLLNYRIIRKVCDHVKEHLRTPMLYGMTTNGTVLNDEIIDLLHQNKFVLTVSLDGNEAINNTLRPDKSNQGHFTQIVSNMDWLKREGIHFAIEATYTNVHVQHGVSIL